MIIENQEVDQFDPEQQDRILGQMQKQALHDFHSAASIAERGHATSAFADAARAREQLMEVVSARRRRATVKLSAIP